VECSRHTGSKKYLHAPFSIYFFASAKLKWKKGPVMSARILPALCKHMK
jgi:hypothetical protein